MIRPELLTILACPLDPSNTPLITEEDRLLCQRCRVVFPFKEGFPALLIEEATLPAGCAGIEQLPCQQAAKPV